MNPIQFITFDDIEGLDTAINISQITSITQGPDFLIIRTSDGKAVHADMILKDFLKNLTNIGK